MNLATCVYLDLETAGRGARGRSSGHWHCGCRVPGAAGHAGTPSAPHGLAPDPADQRHQS